MKKLLFIALMLISTSGFSQLWVDMMNDPNVNFFLVQKEANMYFETHDKGKGSGWKQYKRWEYEMQFKIDELGNRISDHAIWNEVEKVKLAGSANRPSGPVANWTELGPRSWIGTSSWSPGQGRITCIAVNPANQNEIYVGSPGGGVWKTTDGGTTWNVLTDNLAVLNIYSITIDPINSNIVYVGSSGGGILKSTNAGTTFTALAGGYPSSSATRRILVDPTNNNIVLAATSSGVYRSTDAGANWTLSISATFNDMEFKPGNSSIVYACGNSFYKSTNNGASFTLITSGIATSGRSFISVTPANANYVYMVQARGSEFGYLFRSTDSGDNFTTMVTGSASSGTNYFCSSSSGSSTGGQAWYDMAMCVSPTNADEVYIAGIIIWKSTNGGSSFTAMTEWYLPNSRGYAHADLHALEYVGTTLYTGSDGGIYKSTDGGDNFTDYSNGLGIRQYYRIGGSKTVPSKITAGAQDNGTSVLSSGNWKVWLGADGMETIIDHTNANILYGTSQYGGLYKSTDGGNTRTNLPAPASGAWVTPFIMDPITPTTLYTGYNEVYKSSNSGSSWSPISSLGIGTLTALAIAPSDPNYIYASNGSSIYVTKNGGTTWTNVTTGITGGVQYITVHYSNPEKVVITGSARVYKSTNAGTAWTNITGTLPALTGKCVVYQDGADEGLYVALSLGVYYRNNTMSDWIPFMTGLPQVQLSELEINNVIGKIRVATYGRGVWESDLPCSSPGGLWANNLTATTATLHWGAQPNGMSFNVKWKKTGTTTWLGDTTVSNDSLNISGLTIATEYDYSVRTTCDYGPTAFTSSTFRTFTPCTTPWGLTVSTITSSTAKLGWATQSDASSYYVLWRKIGASWSSATVSTNTFNISGLLASTNYEFTVRANCSSGATAYATPYKAFTTLAAPPQPDLTINSQSFKLPDYVNQYIQQLRDYIDRINCKPCPDIRCDICNTNMPSCGICDVTCGICDAIQLNIDPIVVAGEPIDMSCYVSNISINDAPWNYTSFYLSKYASIDYYSRYIGGYYLDGVAKLSSEYITRRCTIPLDAEVGYQYLLYNADEDNLISESNESNNLKYIKVFVVGPPNTRIDYIYLPPPGLAHGDESGDNGLLKESTNAVSSLNIYPNPTSGLVNISFPVQEDGIVDLSIYDITGKKVAGFDQKFLKAGSYDTSYMLYDLPGAAYICRLITNNKVETIKLIKE